MKKYKLVVVVALFYAIIFLGYLFKNLGYLFSGFIGALVMFASAKYSEERRERINVMIEVMSHIYTTIKLLEQYAVHCLY